MSTSTLIWQQDTEFFQCQNLETEFGTLTLEKINSDRGRWRFTKNLIPGKHEIILNLAPLYFFDEDIAKIEIEKWMETSINFAQTEVQSEFKLSFRGEKILHGSCCMVTVGSVLSNDSIFKGYFANVTVPREIEHWLTVDSHDMFPRIFLHEESAIQEMNSWIQIRGEELEFSQWIYLV